ncbi:hypothetical protein Srufu_019130 [Streptomyces libani subsp. rufus]|nr:hypothetical protein Srufu_019130 [Streptomyces libani subsp. rufus]
MELDSEEWLGWQCHLIPVMVGRRIGFPRVLLLLSDYRNGYSRVTAERPTGWGSTSAVRTCLAAKERSDWAAE